MLPDITSKESDLADLGYFGDTLPTGSRDTNDRFSYIQPLQFHDYWLKSPVYCAALLGTTQNNKKKINIWLKEAMVIRMVLNCELAGIKTAAAKGCIVSSSDNI